MSQSRQLAAIMFTDIVGYSALMGEDELAAFELLKKNRAIQRPIIEKFNGRWLKEIGDGVLASFSTVSDAVYCAKEIQEACLSESDLKLRIGIHLGEVVFEGNDVFGDGVNIASRLEPLAPIGGILVSESVHRNLGNKRGIETKFLREEQLKNVKEPIKIYSVQVEGVMQAAVRESAATAPNNVKMTNGYARKIAFMMVGSTLILLLSYLLYSNFRAGNVANDARKAFFDKSIVVLPFTNMSSDPEQEYFSDGIMEEILNHLVKIEDLKVISRTTSMQYKESTKSIKEITEELNVATALEGSVRKEGDRVRITVQLIEGDTDIHLWSESYDRQLTNIFEVQSEVAQLIASVLQAEVTPEVKLRIESQPTIAMDAYDYYLRGNESYWASWTHLDIEKVYGSIEYYEKALEIDNEFSLAYTGIGRSYWWLAHYWNADLDIPSIWRKSYEYLNEAIRIDPYNGWAYGELAVVSSNWLWDTTATSNNLELAMKLMPNDANVYIHYFYHHFRLGNCDNLDWALERLRQITSWAKSPYVQHSLNILSCRNDYQKLASISDELRIPEDINTNQAIALFDACLYENRLDKAQQILDFIESNVKMKSFFYVRKALLSAAEQNLKSTNAMLDSLEFFSEHEIVPRTYYAAIKASTGDREAMYKYLNQALENHERDIHDINNFSQFNQYKEEPRFKEIVAKMWTPFK